MSNTKKEETKKFCSFYGISIVNENRGYRSNYNKYFTDPLNADIVIDSRDRYYSDHSNLRVDFDVEEIVILELPKRALSYMAHTHEMFHDKIGNGDRVAKDILERQEQEAHLRNTVPAVQLAWEQYSLMLNLSSNGRIPD